MTEVLSPAGDLDRLKWAIIYGADAVYIGGYDYSLRANANNFSVEDIKEAVDFAHKYNRRVYVTVNILFHNEEEVVAVFTHDIALESLFTIWCDKGYSLENQMILNYKDNVIIDGGYHKTRIFRLDFEGDKLRNITWEKEKEL